MLHLFQLPMMQTGMHGMPGKSAFLCTVLCPMQVADNGKGVSPEDHAALALKYHTSKISQFQDLEVCLVKPQLTYAERAYISKQLSVRRISQSQSSGVRSWPGIRALPPNLPLVSCHVSMLYSVHVQKSGKRAPGNTPLREDDVIHTAAAWSTSLFESCWLHGCQSCCHISCFFANELLLVL